MRPLHDALSCGTQQFKSFVAKSFVASGLNWFLDTNSDNASFVTSEFRRLFSLTIGCGSNPVEWTRREAKFDWVHKKACDPSFLEMLPDAKFDLIFHHAFLDSPLSLSRDFDSLARLLSVSGSLFIFVPNPLYIDQLQDPETVSKKLADLDLAEQFKSLASHANLELDKTWKIPGEPYHDWDANGRCPRIQLLEFGLNLCNDEVAESLFLEAYVFQFRRRARPSCRPFQLLLNGFQKCNRHDTAIIHWIFETFPSNLKRVVLVVPASTDSIGWTRIHCLAQRLQEKCNAIELKEPSKLCGTDFDGSTIAVDERAFSCSSMPSLKLLVQIAEESGPDCINRIKITRGGPPALRKSEIFSDNSKISFSISSVRSDSDDSTKFDCLVLDSSTFASEMLDSREFNKVSNSQSCLTDTETQIIDWTIEIGSEVHTPKQISRGDHFESHSSSEKRNQVTKLSLCMIVRDNESIIGRCIEGIRPFVDEMIVVDTGSKDRTPTICADLGAKVFRFPWIDDFAAARNESLRLANGDWIFWMDSDDTIPAHQGAKLRALVDGNHDPNCFGYVMQVHCMGQNQKATTIVDQIKLLRNRDDLRFEFRIHEQILGAIRRAGGLVNFTDIYVEHLGSVLSPTRRKEKLERDLRILQLELIDRPDHPFVLFNLGMTFEDAGQYVQAAQFLEKCVKHSDPSESHVPKAYSLLISCLSHQGECGRAKWVADRAIEHFPADPELRFRRAVISQSEAEFTNAEKDYLAILNARLEPTFRSIDPSIHGTKLFHNLGVLYDQMGDRDRAIAFLNRAISSDANFKTSWIVLTQIYFQGKCGDKLRDLLAAIDSGPNTLLPIASYVHGMIHLLDQQFVDAQCHFQKGWDHHSCLDCLRMFLSGLSADSLQEFIYRSLEKVNGLSCSQGDAVSVLNEFLRKKVDNGLLIRSNKRDGSVDSWTICFDEGGPPMNQESSR